MRFGLGLGLSQKPVALPETDPNFASVTLLAGFDGADGAQTYTEESSLALPCTFLGTGQLDTAQKRFGTSSLLCATGSDYARFTHVGHTFGALDFTIECWVRWAALPGADRYIFSRTDGTANDWYFWYNRNFGRLEIAYWDATNTGDSLVGDFTPVGGTWHHVAATRSGSTWRIFADGALLASKEDAITMRALPNSRLDVGPGGFDGWIDEIRINKGAAYYTAAFTPTTEPFLRS